MEDDRRLLKDFQNGSHLAFEKIYEKYYIHVFTIANKYIRSEEDVKDIRSNSFIKLWELRSKLSFESMSALFTWLRTTTANQCIDHIRKCNTAESKKGSVNHHYVAYSSQDIFEASDKEAIILERLLKQIDLLPNKVKIVFKMRWLSELKFTEIAAQLGEDSSTIKKRYARAITLLKRSFT